MSFTFFMEWLFRAQAIAVALGAMVFLVLFLVASVVDAFRRFKARKGAGS